MAELKNQQETTAFPFKRKPDDPNPQDPPNKAPKLSTLDHNNNSNNNNNEPQQQEEANPNNSKNHTDSEPPTTKERTETDAVQVEEDVNDGNELQNDVVDDDKEYNDNDNDDDEEEESNGEAEVDRKGKGVLRDDKGKGKLIVEEDEGDDDDDDDDSDDDDDDDSDEDGGVSGGDSDFSDDPLAEVDLNNILPSRTRRRTFHPGVHIASDAGNVADDDDDDDDSDAWSLKG